MISKKDIQEKIGKKSFLDDDKTLAAKLDYISGIDFFDEILNGKSLKDSNAVIHTEKYPKGLLFKVAKGFGGIKTYPYPVSNDEIKDFVLKTGKDDTYSLLIQLSENKTVEFLVKEEDVSEVKQFFKIYQNKSGKSNLISGVNESEQTGKDKDLLIGEKSMLSAEGRISRGTFWTRWLVVFIINILLRFFQESMVDIGVIMMTGVIGLLMTIFMIIQGVKRMHDVNKSGWYILLLW